jgi:SNF2 family DNA or RNA helicase
MSVELTEALFSKAAGWEAMKRARAYLEQDHVLSSNWSPPLLRGVVATGETSFRAGLVIKGPIDIENVCTCRESREWGKICAHSVAVGLHWLRSLQPAAPTKPGARNASPVSPNSTQPAPLKAPSLRRATDGAPAELFLILPPNFEQAASRGKVMLVLEAQWSEGRSPLNALPKERAFAFDARDTALIERLEALAGGETPAMVVLDTKEFAAMLPVLAGHSRVTLGKSASVSIELSPLPLPLKATLESSGEILLALKSRVLPPLLLGDEWVWGERTLRPLGLPGPLREVFQKPVRITRAQVPLFLNQFWPQLAASGTVEANFKLDDFVVEPQPPRFLLELKGGLAQLSALLQCAYGPRVMTLGITNSDEGVWLPDPNHATRYGTRDAAAERAALGRLQRSGFGAPDAQGRRQLSGQDAVLNFFAREFPKLQREWEVTMEERLDRSTKQNIERIEPRFQITPSGVQWFDLGVVFESSSGEKFSPADVQRLLLSGQSHTRLRNGRTAVIDTGAVEELQEVLLDCSPQQNAQGYRISNAQAGFLESTLKQNTKWQVQAPAAWRDRAGKQSGDAKLECPPLGELDAVLRPYQKHGVAWLRFLRENSFGGILADEMGLGKTLQVLAFLRSLPPGHRAGPTLVVCPTSLVFNWQAEARKFTPELKVLALHGPDRHARFAEIAQSDLVITSYALTRRDAERYRELEFDTVVLDEAQHIKNRQTQNAQAVKAIRSRHRLVLTGTPLENSVLDLWSIFDFLMPGYLGSAQDFRERYEAPITRERNVEAQARLARRLRPFLLRRLKKEVAADLPEKLEQVSFCELNDDQREIYEQLLSATRKEVLDAVGAQGLARSRMVVLNALLRLRQVCCDLRLLKLERKAETESWSDGVMGMDASSTPQHSITPSPQLPLPSGKLELFSELLEEVIDGGHRVLVFSQFVSMLTIIKAQLAAEDIEFCYLDGSTTDRASVVSRFQNTPSIPVFLISLKAGGVGLNLTGADTVIHFDPWWNPAVEDQATDRAHRIGQTRVVTSYKLITRATVEEKILQLQQRKREVIHATLGGEEQLAGALSWDEIQDLLA